MLGKTLKWPFIAVFIAGLLHFVLEATLPEIHNFFTPPVLGLVQFSFGLWVGYAAVQNGGRFFTALLYGALLGLFPFLVNPLSFGLILGRDLNTTVLAGVFGFSMIIFGSLVAGGFAVSRNESA